jgi:hypothetical protein
MFYYILPKFERLTKYKGSSLFASISDYDKSYITFDTAVNFTNILHP